MKLFVPVTVQEVNVHSRVPFDAMFECTCLKSRREVLGYASGLYCLYFSGYQLGEILNVPVWKTGGGAFRYASGM